MLSLDSPNLIKIALDCLNSIRKRCLLYFYTIRFLRPIQVLSKFLFVSKFTLFKIFPSAPKWLYLNCLFKGEDVLPSGRLLTSSQRQKFLLPVTVLPDRALMHIVGDQILQGTFDFLNHPVVFQEKVDWHIPNVSHLWRYQLHYFQFARCLGISYLDRDDRRYYERFRVLAEDWIHSNPPGVLDGWHPYTISLRSVNWIYGYCLFQQLIEKDVEFGKVLLRSLYNQVVFLSHNIEYQAYGNHLLANLKTLIFAGIFFKGKKAKQWIEKGRELLHQEIDEQILVDGGHFERSPMYHLIVLQDLIEISFCIQTKGIFVEGLDLKIIQMVGFLKSILKPSGNIPLLNDSARDFAEDPKRLIQFASKNFY
jgi:hypothetical protein